MQGYFLAIGELLADIITTDYRKTLDDAKEFQLMQGGSPANLAANIHYLGGNARLVACVGNDGIGSFLRRSLLQAGVPDTHILIHETQPTSIVVVTKSQGSPEFVAYRHSDKYIQPVSNLLLEGASVVHTTSFALSRQPARDSILTSLERAYKAGKTISIDWNFAPQIWGDENGREVLNRIMHWQPVLKLSKDDLERFEDKILSIGECKEILDKYSFKVACITCGKDGVWFSQKKSEWQFKGALPVTKIVDVTGAGDAFWAGFIIGFMLEQNIAYCVQTGLETAAKKIQKQGPLYID
jgi:fructokinase